MPLNDRPTRPDDHHRFLLLHGVLLPLCAVTAAVWLPRSGWDMRLSAWFYDPATRHFLVSGDGWVELLGHRVAKSVIAATWLITLAAAIASPWVDALARHRRLLWTTTLAMALGPVVVTGLKEINTHSCPWDLQPFGGPAAYSAHWFVSRVDAGRCFPGGHASSGYSLFAIALAGRVLGWHALQHGGLLAALAAGSLFSLVRVSQGAHFVSHNLWSFAIDWWAVLLVFLPLLWRPNSAGTTAAGATT